MWQTRVVEDVLVRRPGAATSPHIVDICRGRNLGESFVTIEERPQFIQFMDFASMLHQSSQYADRLVERKTIVLFEGNNGTRISTTTTIHFATRERGTNQLFMIPTPTVSA